MSVFKTPKGGFEAERPNGGSLLEIKEKLGSIAPKVIRQEDGSEIENPILFFNKPVYFAGQMHDTLLHAMRELESIYTDRCN